jgi:hypothetical protein
VSHPAQKELLCKYPFSFFTPSEVSLSIWLRTFPEHREVASVIPLYNVDSSGEALSQAMVKGRIRVAYPGSGQHHKGYTHWQEIVRTYEGNSKYEFFHFGMYPLEPKPRYREVLSSDDDLSPMTACLRENFIDVAVICPIWPETFNIIAHEAYAAGCFIVTTAVSGNVAKFVEENRCGIVLPTPEDVLAYFENEDQVAQEVSDYRKALKEYPRLKFNIEMISGLYA